MIPKIIHACWFGGKPIPEEHQKYIEGWRTLHPDWEIKIWTEENFFKDYLDDSLFVKESIEKKIWGFFSDYARMVLLKTFGGVYLDTDVELLKPLDEFLNADLFMGYIFDCSIGTAVIGASKNNPIITEWIDVLESDYEKKHDFSVSNDWVTNYFINNIKEFKLNGKRQSLPNNIELYPKEYFERPKPKKVVYGGYAVHHCYGSWRRKGFMRKYVKPVVKFVLGDTLYEKFTVRRLTKKNINYKLYKNTIKGEKH